MVKLLRRLDVDLLLEDELNFASLLRSNRGVRRELALPVISIVHHLSTSEEHGWISGFLIKLLEKRFLQGLDGAIYNTNATRESVERMSGGLLKGVVAPPSTEKASQRTVAPGSSGMPGGGDAPRENGKGVRLLTVASLIKRKRIDALIEAVALLEDEAVTLTIVGSGDAEPRTARRLRALVKRYGLTDQVTFAGELDESSLEEAYGEHDLFVLASQYEGFGMVYLEAMCHGLPVVAGSAGGAREIVRDGVNGYLCKPGSGAAVAGVVQTLRRDPGLLESLARGAARTAAGHPTWEESFAPAERFLKEAVRG